MNSVFKKFVQYYLWLMAKLTLLRERPEIIVVAGSVNKTQTKDLIAKALAPAFRVRANPKSYNTEIGLPLAVLDLPSGNSDSVAWFKTLLLAFVRAIWSPGYPNKLVLELGIDRPGDMRYLLSIVQPRVAVLTAITELYVNNFGEFERILDEYRYLIHRLPSDGLLVIDSNDAQAASLAKEAHCRVARYALAEAQVTASGHRSTIKISRDNQVLTVQVKGRGEHLVRALLGSLLVAEFYNLNVASSAASISKT